MDPHTGTTSTLLSELPKLVASIFKEESSKLNEDIVRSQEFISDRFEQILLQMQSLQRELRELRSENENLKLVLNNLKSTTKSVTDTLHRCEADVDNQKRSELVSNAVMLGVPRLPNENTLDLVLKTCNTVGCNFTRDTFECCERIQKSSKEPQPIRITFKRVIQKEELMNCKKTYGKLEPQMIRGIAWPRAATNSIVIRDDLTPLSMALLRELKQIQATGKLRFVWPGRNGSIMVKQFVKSKPIVIRSRADLGKITGRM